MIAPAALGLSFDDRGNCRSEFLIPLKGGAEAQPFLDRKEGVVYKLFDLRPDGGLGKKLVLSPVGEGWELDIEDASVHETIDKLCLLHEAGAHPTEIIGLLDTGVHLLVKQPQATVIDIGPRERALACGRLSTVLMPGSVVRGELRVFWQRERAWLLGDLHRGNVMQGMDGAPAIIDALIGVIPTPLAGRNPEVASAVREARVRVEGGDDGQMTFL